MIKWYDYILIFPLIVKANKMIALANDAINEAKNVKKVVPLAVEQMNHSDPDFIREASQLVENKVLGSILVEMRELAIYDLKQTNAEPQRTALFERVNFIDDLFAEFAKYENAYEKLMDPEEEDA